MQHQKVEWHSDVSLKWVNHASFIVQHGCTAVLCDPWLSGTAFNGGWRHVSPTSLAHADLERVTHIWFSHQHPDHFSPADLRNIPAEIRRNITVLYHNTIDKKVIRFCKSLGFKEEIEMDDGVWLELSDDLRLLCGTWYDTDSWLAIKTPAGTILNLNDCIVDTPQLAARIAKRVGPVRVLMTQFSYAEYCGNAEDTASRTASAREKLRRIAVQSHAFAPQEIVPFASFIYWCHPENFHANYQMNRISAVASFIESSLKRQPVVLYPGDEWRLGEKHDWRDAALRYSKDLQEKIAAGPTQTARTVNTETLTAAAETFVRRLNRNNPLLRVLPAVKTTVGISDLRLGMTLSRHGASLSQWPAQPSIIMHSESLFFCLKFPWGSNALHVNARFTSVGGVIKDFLRYSGRRIGRTMGLRCSLNGCAPC